MRYPVGVGARADKSPDLDARPRLGAAVDVVGLEVRRRRRSGIATGEEHGKPERGEPPSESVPSAPANRQVSLPSVRSFFTTAHPSASVTLAATAARTTLPYPGIHRSNRPAPPLPTILPREA